MGCKQLWYQHAFHVKQGYEDMWCVRVCLCVCARALVYVLFGTFSRRGVCYPCLLESNPRLCLIGVFTLSGLTHTDTLDLGSPPFAIKKEYSDTETCLLVGCERNFAAALLLFFCFPPLCLCFSFVCFKRLSVPFREMNFSTMAA